MKKLKEYLPLSIMICLLAACWAEFILCFLRGYEELWYTILIPAIVVSALAAAGYFTKHRWLYCIATAIVLGGAILLIGFPSYVLYAGSAFGALSLVGEIALLIFHLKERKK
jgi:hypothetical protein